MGMYTGLRFQGVVREKFRKDMDKVVIMGRWDALQDPILREFGDQDRAGFIPHGILTYMPDSWEDEHRIVNCWDENTGHWQFQCSLKNYNFTIEEFIDLLPYLCEYVHLCETMHEEDEYSTLWEVRGNQIYVACKNFRKYGP